MYCEGDAGLFSALCFSLEKNIAYFVSVHVFVHNVGVALVKLSEAVVCLWRWVCLCHAPLKIVRVVNLNSIQFYLTSLTIVLC